jgi:hypothetical protein
MRLTILALLVGLFVTVNAQPITESYIQENEDGSLRLTQEGASHFASLALTCLQQEYPNKLNQVLWDEESLNSPKNLHPAFYGCFDWHSSVHGHWMLVRLLREFPDLPEATEIREKLNQNLSAENIAGEVAYFEQASKSWERMYGWAWLLKLAQELYEFDDPDANRWFANLQPLTDAVVARYHAFLPVQRYPVRTGVHPNTAFGLAFAWDYGAAVGDTSLVALIEERSRFYYLDDKECPAGYEPSGEDFLSPCLQEADLMRRVLDEREFDDWFAGFIGVMEMNALRMPADVSDRSDPKIVHLDGVNLSRAWCIYGFVPYLQQERLRNNWRHIANKHLIATLPHIASEYYEGTHWLASFAVYALSGRNHKKQ